MCSLLCFLLFAPFGYNSKAEAKNNIRELSFSGDGYDVLFRIDNEWTGGFTASVVISNTGEDKIEDWSIAFPLANSIDNIWNAEIVEYESGIYVVKNLGWNQDIVAGGEVSFGFTSYESVSIIPEYYILLGQTNEVINAEYAVSYEISSVWEEGLIGNITITNCRNSVIRDWTLCFDYDGEITDIWGGRIAFHEGSKYEIINADYNQNIDVDNSIVIGIKVTGFDLDNTQFNDSQVFERTISLSGNMDTDVITEDDSVISIYAYAEDSSKLSILATAFFECAEYELFESYDGESFVKINASENGDFIVQLVSEQERYFYYVVGWNEGQQVVSETIEVEYADEKIVVYNKDQDLDGLCDYFEYIYGSNCQNSDSDSDSLLDEFEVTMLNTSPVKDDTDGNGILDCFEDSDDDGLTNLDEQKNKTNPCVYDSDKDGLSDYEELNTYYTNPLVDDSDNDGLVDGDDVELGFDPNDEDTDDDGILDGEEYVRQELNYHVCNLKRKEVTDIKVNIELQGNINKSLSINDVYEKDVLSSGVVGLVGIPVDIICLLDFKKAEVVFSYNPEELVDVEPEDLGILWYDRDNNEYVLLDSVIDTFNNTVSFETTHFSTYMLIDTQEWFDAWRTELDYNNSDGNISNYNISFVIDTSGSMAGIRMNIAKTVAGRFVDAMKEGDYANVVQFHSWASVVREFTSDKLELKKGISRLFADGETDAGDGVSLAINRFSRISNTNNNIMILICDGDINCAEQTIDDCVKKNIKVYTVNVGSSSSDFLMNDISKMTGGEHYYCGSVDSVSTVFGELLSDTIKCDDTMDSDGDGLYDIIEIRGIRLQNGRIVFTDPNKQDTDGDGLTDFEEVGIPYRKTINVCGEYREVVYFKLRSDPTSVNTDLDDKNDKNDKRPYDFDTIENLLVYQSKYKKGEGDDGEGGISRAEDLMYADKKKEDIISLRNFMDVQLNCADNEKQGANALYADFEFLAKNTSMGIMQDVAFDMISHAANGNGSDYSNENLTEKVLKHKSTQNYIESIRTEIQNRIKLNGGELSSLKYTDESRNDDKSFYSWVQNNVDHPKFNTAIDTVKGLKFCIDDIAGNTVEIRNYSFDGTNYTGKLHFCIYDYFGLDRQDVIKYGFVAGFRAWYVLQHYDVLKGSYIPYVTVIEFDIPFEGAISKYVTGD